ncbi:igE-binding protein-like [Cavia porcellus]|uniref:igE-binding protein-like n=1 Tax=Cavia porcellus TaxID=10141 RepID=UPI002FE170FC
MGNTATQPLSVALSDLLREKGLQMKREQIQNFLNQVDKVAPWFGPTGSITIPSWDKLGRDLDFAVENGLLEPGVRPLWAVVRSCLADTSCRDHIRAGAMALDYHQAESSREQSRESSAAGEVTPPNPDSSDNEGEEGEVYKMVDADTTERGEVTHTQLRGPYSEAINELQRRISQSKWVNESEYGIPGPPRIRPMALPPDPPDYHAHQRPCHQLCSCPQRVQMSPGTFQEDLWHQVKREDPGGLGRFLQAFPVAVDAQGNRAHLPIDMKAIKHLKEASTMYGVNGAYTLSLVEALAGNAMTPADWASLCKAVLSPGQYLDWKAWNVELATEQGQANAQNNQAAWNADMLLGQGQYLNNQLIFPQEVYAQINRIAIQAWKRVSARGEVSGHLTKILQGPSEPFSDFVACMMEAAGRIFRDTETAMPLIKQLTAALGQHQV